MENEKIKKTYSRVAMEWGAKSLVAIIPAILASYFSMREAKIAADIEIARINARANAGYETMVDAVKELETRAKIGEEDVRKLELRLDALFGSISVRTPRSRSAEEATEVELQKPSRTPKSHIKLPKTLDDAAQVKGAT